MHSSAWAERWRTIFPSITFGSQEVPLKPHSLLIALVMAGLFAIPLSSQKNLPATPGQLEASKHPLALEPPLEPQPQKLDAAQLRRDAGELSQLAQTVPADINQVAGGKLPKDLADKLKHIEKLSKKLRGELAR
jgi:hypothetical protein